MFTRAQTQDDPSPPLVLRKGEQTRLVLLAAARRVFASEGYLKAEISQIARAAGKSSGVFYNYFENKSDLLRNLVEAFREELRTSGLNKPINEPEEMPDVLAALWASYKAHAATFLALTEAAAVDPSFDEMYQLLRRHARADFACMIHAQQKKGLCAGIDPHHTAAALETMINYCLYEWLARGQGQFADPAQEAKAFRTLIFITQSTLGLPVQS